MRDVTTLFPPAIGWRCISYFLLERVINICVERVTLAGG